MYRISQIKLGIDEDLKELKIKISKKIKVSESDILNIKIVRESIDARNKKDIKLVYTIDFTCRKDIKPNPKIHLTYSNKYEYQPPKENLDKNIRPVVVGFGPSGIFCALILAQCGYRPIVLERGKDVDSRSKDVEEFWTKEILNTESNVQFGEGGAGTFSDGKLTTGIKDARIQKVLRELYEHGANENILYKQKPHIGTDKLKSIIKNIRQTIISLGGEVRFSHKLIDIKTENVNHTNKISTLKIQSPEGIYELPCTKLILAIGHSARDTFPFLYERGLDFSQKPISMGLRVEHPQKIINIAQYGDDRVADKLGAAEYKLSCKAPNGRGVYTFCMCPGGVVIMSSSEKESIVSNGMSYSQRDGKFANSAILVDIKTTDYGSSHPLAGFEFQRKYENAAFNINKNYFLLECKWKEFEHSPLYKVLPSYVSESISFAMKEFGKKIKGFDGESATFKGIETRSSSPVRCGRKENFESNILGIYPCGEGMGYAGGIMSAAVDGIKVAESIIEDRS